MRIYTKRGDDGTTGLLYGGRVPKDDLRTAAYGTVDEAVSVMGLARCELDAADDLAVLVLDLQRQMFALGAQLATRVSEWDRLQARASKVDDEMVAELEAVIDEWVERHPLPQEFVVPGGSRAAAALDVARTVVRRAERAVVTLHREQPLPDDAPLRYLNRLSDLLFVLARAAEGTHVSSRAS